MDKSIRAMVNMTNYMCGRMPELLSSSVSGQVQVRSRSCPGQVQVNSRSGPGPDLGPDPVPVRSRLGPGPVKVWSGPGLVQVFKPLLYDL